MHKFGPGLGATLVYYNCGVGEMNAFLSMLAEYELVSTASMKMPV